MNEVRTLKMPVRTNAHVHNRPDETDGVGRKRENESGIEIAVIRER